MRQKNIIVCDSDPNYAGLFSGYIMDHVDGASISIFCNPESFLKDAAQYDVGIMAKEYLELLNYKDHGGVYASYYLSEEDGDMRFAPIEPLYKYQPMEKMISRISELNDVSQLKGELKKNHREGLPRLVGVYSPIAHELQLPFALALGQLYGEGSRVLFLDLEEISILAQLLEIGNEGRNISDLLYLAKQNSANLRISDFTYEFNGMDLILPFSNPEEINELDISAWDTLLNLISGASYDVVVALFGRSLKNFSEVLDSLDELVLIGREGDYFDKSFFVFDQYIKASGISPKILSIQLPLTASALRDGSYCIEELLAGNLGVFVRRLMNKDGMETVRAAYG